MLVHNFKDDEWDTRFLGDLYERLSDDIRDKYALLQTPDFVEEFILKYTLDPAIEEFGLDPEPPHGHERLPHRLRVIDPACGSGHFLLGAFHRLLQAWKDASGDTDQWKLINNAMTSVHGVDKNPYAVAIARFRLMLAGMRAAGVDRLDEQVDFPLNIAVGDSLLHGFRSYGSQDELPYGEEEEDPAYTWRTEDIDSYIKSVHMLAFGSYHAVFANPPYITVRDEAENKRYRELYASCYRQYSLSVPFAERIFKLAIRGSLARRWRRLHRPDHRQLVHETGVRQETNRRVLYLPGRSDACNRYVWCPYPRSRYADGHHLRSMAIRAPGFNHPCSSWASKASVRVA